MVAPTARLQDETLDAQPAVRARSSEELILGPESGHVMAGVDRAGKGILGRSVWDISNGVRTCW